MFFENERRRRNLTNRLFFHICKEDLSQVSVCAYVRASQTHFLVSVKVSLFDFQ